MRDSSPLLNRSLCLAPRSTYYPIPVQPTGWSALPSSSSFHSIGGVGGGCCLQVQQLLHFTLLSSCPSIIDDTVRILLLVVQQHVDVIFVSHVRIPPTHLTGQMRSETNQCPERQRWKVGQSLTSQQRNLLSFFANFGKVKNSSHIIGPSIHPPTTTRIKSIRKHNFTVDLWVLDLTYIYF